jgi:uncharacterized protein YbjT (DUF2867 family)
MAAVAIAGGTGKLGRAIVDSIIATGQFEVVVLARQVYILNQQPPTRKKLF